MKNYKQLYLFQRYQIQTLFNLGLSQIKIAQQIGFHGSTISCELKRNVFQGGRTAGEYIGEHAQAKTDFRHANKQNRAVLIECLKKRTEGLLKYEKWSP